jgi:hypothetical protein
MVWLLCDIIKLKRDNKNKRTNQLVSQGSETIGIVHSRYRKRNVEGQNISGKDLYLIINFFL